MFAVLSDVHANLEALNSVIKDIKSRGISDIFFLGDAVGYGPNPKETLYILKDISKVFVAGNHDKAVVEPSLEPYFNDLAREAIIWTRNNLDDRSKALLETLPYTFTFQTEIANFFFVHASPRYPEEWNYILTLRDAELNFYYFTQKICFVGHSHSPFVVEKAPQGELIVRKENPVKIKSGSRYIINAGSVGQPRDGDPRACYVIFNDDHVLFVRIKYDLELTQKKMKEAGLPYPLIERLGKGV